MRKFNAFRRTFNPPHRESSLRSGCFRFRYHNIVSRCRIRPRQISPVPVGAAPAEDCRRANSEQRASAAGRLRPARLRKPHPTPPDYHRPTEKRSAPRLPHPIPNHPLQPPIRNRISPYRVLPKLIRQAPTGRNRVGLLTIRTGLFAFPPKEHPSAEESYQQLPSLSTARSSVARCDC